MTMMMMMMMTISNNNSDKNDKKNKIKISTNKRSEIVLPYLVTNTRHINAQISNFLE